MSLVSCVNAGCRKEFDPEENHKKSCRYHTGQPVFHEGWKYWSCCEGSRFTSFDEFLGLPGCTRGPHVEPPPKEPIPVFVPAAPPPPRTEKTPVKPRGSKGKKVYVHYEGQPALTLPMVLADETETVAQFNAAFVDAYNAKHGSTNSLSPDTTQLANKRGKPYKASARANVTFEAGDDVFCAVCGRDPTATKEANSAPTQQLPPEPEPESVPEPPAPPMTEEELDEVRTCVRCKQTYTERGNGPDLCLHHPGTPLFHEGAKGWTCCRRTVWTFDEFLNLKPCAKSRHTDVQATTGFYARKGSRAFQWEQDAMWVTVRIPIGGVAKKDCTVDFDEENASIAIKRDASESGSEYVVDIDLPHAVVPRLCKFDTTASEVVVRLRKKEVGKQWARLA